ncbi:MAG: hypothetical protein N2Z64_05145 [Dictyoglomus thermophilum]|nr:hypothetical protein [Dictyoglomus thermophilum]MCX7720652.1 hypothetical protein [Dictyoglomus thermophilum]
MRKSKKIKCPKCGSKNVIPIIYGYPTSEAFEKEKRGEIILGGCVIEYDSPNWYCKECGYKWLDINYGDIR